MEDKPFFSIIMPVFNVEPFVRQAVDSVVSQSFSDWELIIVDDASTDNTLTVLKDFQDDKRIRIVESEKNSGGGFKPREIAAKMARGQYVVPIDSDDIVDLSLLQGLYDCIRKNNSSLVLNEMWRFGSELSNAYKVLPAPHIDIHKTWKGRDLVKYTINGWKIPVAGFACKSEIYLSQIEKVKNSLEKSFLADELLSRYLLLFSDKVNFVTQRYYYRVNPNSITNNTYNEFFRLEVVNGAMVEFSKKYFGKDSEEHKKAKTSHFLTVPMIYSELFSGKFDKRQQQTLLEFAKEVRGKVSFKEARKNLSFPYYMALLLPVPLGIGWMRAVNLAKKLK